VFSEPAQKIGLPTAVHVAFFSTGYNAKETRTEAFALEMEPNHQTNGAILSSCYQRMKEFLAAIAGGDTDSAMSYLQSGAHLTDEANQSTHDSQTMMEWFASHFGNRPVPTVKVRSARFWCFKKFGTRA
jgi:hypothetical protein